MQRRDFLQSSSVGLASMAAVHSNAAMTQEPRRIVIGIMGCSRGAGLMMDLFKIPGVVLKYLCDTDSSRLTSTLKTANDGGRDVSGVGDFRKILDDKEVDVLFCAAPNHWHGPATILACKAGKHVYVEKPACHNPQEGVWMVEAANKANKCVQVGTQRRSSQGYQNAIAKVKSGAIGDVYLSRCFFQRLRGTIGKGMDSQPPANLDYDLWQGPAPKRPFRANVVHYNWHWFWHWGNGELGNNGIHGLDICRWGLGVDYPIRTVSSGGRYGFQDDQETPDTHSVCWEFEGGKQITYQGLSLTQTLPGPFVSFYGSEGYLEIDTEGAYSVHDRKGKVIESTEKSDSGQMTHLENFIAAVRADDPTILNQPILSGHKSTMLCHLGNVAHRTNRVLATRASDGRWTDESIPSHLWRREYDPKWESLIST